MFPGGRPEFSFFFEFFFWSPKWPKIVPLGPRGPWGGLGGPGGALGGPGGPCGGPGPPQGGAWGGLGGPGGPGGPWGGPGPYRALGPYFPYPGITPDRPLCGAILALSCRLLINGVYSPRGGVYAVCTLVPPRAPQGPPRAPPEPPRAPQAPRGSPPSMAWLCHVILPGMAKPEAWKRGMATLNP